MSIICSKCGTQFDSPFCPNCGTPAQTQMQTPSPPLPPQYIPPKKKSKALFYVSMVFGILIFIGVIGSLLSETIDKENPKVVQKDGFDKKGNSKTASSVTEAPTPEPEAFGIGDTVKLNDILVTLVGVTESNGGNFNKPSDGNVFVLCEFDIENNSNNDIAVSSLLSFEAYCDDYSINISLPALLEKGDKNQLDGSVASGKKMNGVIGYEVPANWKELEIAFTPDVWSGKGITFIVSK